MDTEIIDDSEQIFQEIQDSGSSSTEYPKTSDYKSLSEIEHVLLRAGMYIGSVKQNAIDEWVLDSETMTMVRQTISFPQGLERLFIEVLTNAGDNAIKSRALKVPPGKIEIMMDHDLISVTNGGVPMPVDIHPETGLYVPELVFGTMRSSSNYDENVKRTGAGLNGLGVKLVNIFSLNFTVVVCDGQRKLKYIQEWSENMTQRSDPYIEEYSGPSTVQVIYKVDFKRFGYEQYPDETFWLFARHAADASFNYKLPVTFNGIEMYYPDIRDYATLYFGKEQKRIVHYEWDDNVVTVRKAGLGLVAKNPTILANVELCVVDTPDEGAWISFVNGIMTKDGGVHVDQALKALTGTLLSELNESSGRKRGKNSAKKNSNSKKDKKDNKKPVKEIKLTAGDIKPHLSIILTCRLNDPEFVGQHKSVLSSPTPRIAIDERELNPIFKWDLIERLRRSLEAKHFRTLAKTDGKKRRHIRLDKGEMANNAGGVLSMQCSLYAVEGGSAAGYVEKMRDFIDEEGTYGTDFIGFIPFKGKPLNVMDCKFEKILRNKEFERLKTALGLKEDVDYTSDANFRTLSTLR